MASVELVARVEQALREIKNDKPSRVCEFSQATGKHHVRHREKVKDGPYAGTFRWVDDAQLDNLEALARYLGVAVEASA